MGNRDTNLYIDAVIEGLKAGKTPKEIASEVGCSRNYVYAIADKYGITFTKQITGPSPSALTVAMREYKAQGHSYKEVQERFGVSRDAAHNACKGIAPQNDNAKQKQIDAAIKRICEKATGFDYIGGYDGNTGHVILRCQRCGQIVKKACQSIRKGHLNCPACDEIAKQDRRQKQEEKARQRKERTEKEKRKKQKQKEREKLLVLEAKKHPCPVCGKITIRAKYCCDACAKKATNKRREMRRRVLIRNAMVDKDITVQGLFKRDHGRCYICGLACSFEDYTVQDGTIICGDWYPSIDHIVPLTKGGAHSWKNVALAHRRCNSFKRDNDTRRMETEYQEVV